MKRTKLSQRHCEKIIQMYQLGNGYSRISRLLKISRYTVRVVIQTWKRRGGFAHLQGADQKIHIYAKTSPANEISMQTEKQVDDIQKLKTVKIEPRTATSLSQCSQTRRERLNKAGQSQSAAPRPAKWRHSCAIAGAVIAVRGKKGWFRMSQNSDLNMSGFF